MASANYHSLETKLTRRFDAGLTFLAGYTWSKTIDTGSGIRTLDGDTLFPQNSYCLRCERSLSIFDTRHRFVSSVLYELPFGKGKRYLNQAVASAVLGGWELSSIVTISSGFPRTVSTGGALDRANIGRGADRPNTTGAPANLPRGQRNPQRWFNTDAFVLEPAGTFGNVGRNTVIGPGILAWDFATLKNFRFTESKELQFRFEAFNFPNHPIWGDPDACGCFNAQTGLPSLSFGTITSTRRPMRELQFGLKFIF